MRLYGGAVRDFTVGAVRAARSVRRALARLRRRQDGATAIMMGVMATALVGFAGLAAEGGSWYVIKRNAQTAADTAAQAGAVALLWDRAAAPAAHETSTRNGFTHGVSLTTVTVNAPPASGPNAGNASAVEVIVQRQVPLQLASVFLGGNATIAARAVATALTLDGGGACVLALGRGGGELIQDNDLQIGGTATVNAPNCSLASNTSIRQFGNSRITAFTMVAAGEVAIGNPGNVTLTRPAASYQPPIQDPFAPEVPGTGVPLPPSSQACTQTGFRTSPTSTVPLSAGVYCNGMDLRGTHNLSPGVYYIQNGGLTINAQATLTCTSCTAGNGVTFVFTGEPAQIGGPQINGQASINLIGGTGGYPGMLMYQDPRRPVGSEYTLNGGANIHTEGLFYFPSSDLRINGNFGGTNSTCKAFIAESITLVGTTEQTISVDGCEALGLDPDDALPQIRIARLVE